MDLRAIYKVAFVFSLLLSSCGPTDDFNGEKGSGLLQHKLSAGDDIVPTADMAALADHAFQEGDLMRSHSMYSQLLMHNPDNVEHLLKVAHIERLLGKFDLSHKNYGRVLSLDPDSYEALEGFARLYLAEGKLPEAVETLQAIVTTYPAKWQAYDNLGTAYALLGDFESALSSFRKALAIKPESARVLNNMGLSEVLAGNLKSATKILTRASEAAVKEGKNQTQVDLNLAFVHALSQDLDLAEAVVSRHLEGKELYNNLGVYAALAKDRKIANSFLQKSLVSSLGYYDKAWSNLAKLEKSSKH